MSVRDGDGDGDGEVSGDVLSMVKALKEASHDLPKNAKNVENLVEGLKRMEKRKSGALKDPKLRRKLLSLCNLMEPQLERARKLANRRGLKYYISRAKGKVLGNDISNVAVTMESEIQSWLDRQNMEHLVKLLDSQGCKEEEIVDALAGFEARVKEGYNPELQDVILSLRVFDSLTCLLSRPLPLSWSPRVQKEAAFALAALVHFNKDVFVSQILMSGVVDSLLSMVAIGIGDADCDLSIGVVSVIGSLVAAGKGAVVDDIHGRGGVKKIVGLLEDKRDEMRLVAMDCVFEIAYYGRKEAVEAMLEEDVVGKLAHLQHSQAGGDLIDLPMHLTRKDSSSSTSSTLSLHQECLGKLMEDESEIEIGGNSMPSTSQRTESSLESGNDEHQHHYSAVEEYWQEHPFASAVSRFAIQLEIGQGLRQREKRALKQEILKHVRKAVPCDAEVATIFAEVLWGP